jgi:hypothetical protein
MGLTDTWCLWRLVGTVRREGVLAVHTCPLWRGRVHMCRLCYLCREGAAHLHWVNKSVMLHCDFEACWCLCRPGIQPCVYVAPVWMLAEMCSNHTVTVHASGKGCAGAAYCFAQCTKSRSFARVGVGALWHQALYWA